VEEEGDLIESQYENNLANFEDTGKKLKALLPFKTSRGLQAQTIEVDEEEIFSKAKGKEVGQKDENEEEEEEEEEEDKMPYQDCIVSVGKLVAEREEKLMQYKLRIGTLSAGFLEDPYNRVIMGWILNINREKILHVGSDLRNNLM
jgi:hypothetical protein